MGLFWPSREREQPTLAVKLGRLIHWTCIGVAAAMLPGMLSDFIDGWARIRFLLISLFIALLGRALRYIIARE